MRTEFCQNNKIILRITSISKIRDHLVLSFSQYLILQTCNSRELGQHTLQYQTILFSNQLYL